MANDMKEHAMTRQSLRGAALDTAAACLDRARAPGEHDNPVPLRRAAIELHGLVRLLDHREPADTAACIPRWRRLVDAFHRTVHGRGPVTAGTAQQLSLDIDQVELSTAATTDVAEFKTDTRTR